jgi:thioredoxin 1
MAKRSNRTAPLHLTKNTFDEVVAASDGLLMVTFWADWCAPCHAMAPVLEDLAANSGDRVIRAKVHVDETPGLADRYGITAVPTVLLFREAARSWSGSPAPCQELSSTRSWTREREAPFGMVMLVPGSVTTSLSGCPAQCRVPTPRGKREEPCNGEPRSGDPRIDSVKPSRAPRRRAA